MTMHIILFDTDLRDVLLPFTHTKPVCELRVGILTIREKWGRMLGTTSISYITTEHLEPSYPIKINDDNYLINGAAIPNDAFIEVIRTLNSGEALMLKGELVAARLSKVSFEKLLVKQDSADLVGYEIEPDLVSLLDSLTSFTETCRDQILADMELMGRTALVPEGLDVVGDYPVFIDTDATVERAFINAKEGPVYVGKDTLVMDGANLRGPVSIGDGSIVKSHAFLSKGTCVGPKCEVGGEIKQSVMLGYSNKSHEGYLGDSVIGEWCNLGALTSNSNLRNTFSEISIWNYEKEQPEPTGKIKCGFFMGDYSRTAIHTQINSGTVIGISCHIFGAQTIAGFVPSFTWGNMDSPAEYDLEKAIQSISTFRSFKGEATGDELKDLLTRIFKQTGVYRSKHS